MELKIAITLNYCGLRLRCECESYLFNLIDFTGYSGGYWLRGYRLSVLTSDFFTGAQSENWWAVQTPVRPSLGYVLAPAPGAELSWAWTSLSVISHHRKFVSRLAWLWPVSGGNTVYLCCNFPQDYQQKNRGFFSPLLSPCWMPQCLLYYILYITYLAVWMWAISLVITMKSMVDIDNNQHWHHSTMPMLGQTGGGLNKRRSSNLWGEETLFSKRSSTFLQDGA